VSRVLSRRERELLDLLRDRLTNKEIAARLNLSQQTVKNHVHHILRKVGAPDRISVVERSEMEGLAIGTKGANLGFDDISPSPQLSDRSAVKPKQEQRGSN